MVWDEDIIYALDTKGRHLMIQDSERKPFCIEKAYKEGPDLFVRLISEKNIKETVKMCLKK